MKHYIRQKTDNSIQYTRHLIHKPRSIVLSKGHLTRNTFKSNIFMLINKLIVKFYVHGSLGVLQSWYLAYWWVSNCFFHELSYVKSLDFGPTFFVVIFNVICLTINNLSGILDTTDTSFVHPCKWHHWCYFLLLSTQQCGRIPRKTDGLPTPNQPFRLPPEHPTAPPPPPTLSYPSPTLSYPPPTPPCQP